MILLLIIIIIVIVIIIIIIIINWFELLGQLPYLLQVSYDY